MPQDNVFFNRPPRLRAAPVQAELELPTPPNPTPPSATSMIVTLLPMAGMLGIAVLYLVVGSGSVMILPMVMMVGLSAAAGVLGFSIQRNRQRIGALQQRLDHERLVDRRLARVQAGVDLQRDLLAREYPPAHQILTMLRERSNRLWTRRPEDSDFCAVRLGMGDVKSRVVLRFPDPDGKNEGLRRVLDAGFDHQVISDAPIVLTLATSGTMGVIGPRKACIPVMYSLIAQLAAFHAPDVLQLYMVGSKSEYMTWQWLRWLPHTSEDGSGGFATNLAFDEGKVRQLLLKLSNQLETGEESDARTLRILMVENLGLVRHDPNFSRLLTAPGLIALCMAESVAELPDVSGAVLDVKNHSKFTLSLADETGGTSSGRVDSLSRADIESFARTMAAMRLPGRAVNNRIPTSVSFLQLFNHAQTVDELRIFERWTHAPDRANHVSLPFPVPIGMRSFSDPLVLHLSDGEYAHGPHLELGGTTGYGKSVLLETYVTALTVEHPPQFLNFMLFDFKGGNTFEPFRHLPHTVGTITNLDASSGGSMEIEAQRALVALAAERRRREKMLVGYKDIHDYYRRTLINPRTSLVEWNALPFLIIIVDEFAELLRQMPAFLKELISTVRLGRTSGMHLILATQNPAADINSDIRGNLKSHILLRVNADHDSMTVIRSAAAARTDIKGRAYIQSGSAPAIEFQTASARGLYNPENQSSTTDDLVLYDMERVVTPVQSQDEPSTSANSVMKAVIEAVDHIHDSWQVSELPKVLPDPLPAHRHVEDLLARVPNRWDTNAQAWHSSRAANPITRAPLGLIDDIESQLIRTLEFALDETADHLLIASPRSFGKTSALLTLARSIATCWRPDEVMLYGLNFAARDLDILEDLPHIGAVINKDETERIDRLFIWLEEELQRRARQLSITRKATVWQYNAWARAATPKQRKQLPYLAPIVVLLDGGAEFMNSYLMQTHDFAAMTHQVARILRDGRNLGVIFAVSVSSSNDLPDDLFKLMQSRRIVMGLSTTPEYVGYFNEMPERDSYFRPGAGLMSGSPLLQVQIALPETTHNLERLSQGFRAMAAAAERQQITPAATSIEALPGDVRLDGEPSPANRIPTTGLMHWVAQARPPAEHMLKYPSVRAILGVSGRDQAPLVVEMRPGAHFVAASAPQGGKTTLLKSFTYSAAWLNGPQAFQISVIDPAGEFSWMRRLPHVQWLTGAQEITDCIKTLQRESLHRSQKVSELFVKLSDEMDEASSASIEDLCMIHHQPHLVVIDNYERLSAVVPNLNAGVLTNIAQNANRTRIHFLVSVPASGYSADQFISYLLSKRSGFAVGSLEAVNLLGRLTSALIRQKFPMGRGYVVNQDEMTLAQFCRIGDERAVMQKITQQWGSAAPAPATPGISDAAPAVTESPSINGEPVEISTPQYQTILDEPFDPEQEIVETLRFLNESYPYYEKLPDVQDVLAAYESQQDEDTYT